MRGIYRALCEACIEGQPEHDASCAAQRTAPQQCREGVKVPGQANQYTYAQVCSKAGMLLTVIRALRILPHRWTHTHTHTSTHHA